MNNKAYLPLFVLLSSLPGCSDSSEAAGLGRGKIVDSSAGTVALGIGDETYKSIAVSGGAAIAGAVTQQGVAPDSMVAVTKDPNVCGDSASVTETRGTGTSLANVLVWVEGVGAGKPLPDLRRDRLTIENCRFEPRVLAVTAGTTINVMSRDRATLTSRFYREGAGDPVEQIHTVDAGQLVPSEKIARSAGIVEVRSVQHPWVRAYVAVFDHPYFAVTDDRGNFIIDNLPPGTYTVKLWHERLHKPMEQRVVVGPGGSGRLDLSLALK